MAGHNGRGPHANGSGPNARAHGRHDRLARREANQLSAAKQQALDAAKRYGVQVDGIAPHEGLLEVYAEACGLVEFWRLQVVELNGKLETTGPAGARMVHPFVAQHENVLELKAKVAVWCIKAGIEEKRLMLEAARAEVVLRSLKEAVAEAGLTPDKQRLVLTSFGERIRQLVA